MGPTKLKEAPTGDEKRSSLPLGTFMENFLQKPLCLHGFSLPLPGDDDPGNKRIWILFHLDLSRF